MVHRYSLRFESGERRGETIPITGNGFSVGRKPGNSLQILDNSVSGKHAELSIDDQGVFLRDLGSTNGTRVGKDRVLEGRVAPGDAILFGNIKLILVDARAGSDTGELVLEDEPSAVAPLRMPMAPAPAASAPARALPTAPAPSASGASAASASPRSASSAATSVANSDTSSGSLASGADGLERVSADVLAKSKKRSTLGGAVVLVLAAAGGGLYFWLNQAGSGAEPKTSAVRPVAGNLLETDYSFEGERETWAAREDAPVAFLKNAAARHSGAFGLEASLADAEWSLTRSPSVRAQADRRFTLAGAVRARGQARARLGIEFTRVELAEGIAPIVFTAWSHSVSAGDYEEIQLEAAVPPGFTSARAVAYAVGSGSAHIDDVSLIERAEAYKSELAVGDFSFQPYGNPSASALLHKVDHALVTGLELLSASALTGSGDVTFSAKAEGAKITLQPSAGAAALCLRAEPELVRARIATMGASASGDVGKSAGKDAGDGYRTHAADFQRAGVTSLILGTGADVVRVLFASPVAVTSVGESGGARIRVTLGQAGGVIALQLDFNEERKHAASLASAARDAEKKIELGAAIAKWGELLNGYPYEEALVNEAESTRSRLLQRGLEELRVVDQDIERARFFRLADIYRQCRDQALAVGKRFAGSELEAAARTTADTVGADLALLETDLNQQERVRVRAILAALEARKATSLAAELRTYLTEKLGEK